MGVGGPVALSVYTLQQPYPPWIMTSKMKTNRKQDSHENQLELPGQCVPANVIRHGLRECRFSTPSTSRRSAARRCRSTRSVLLNGPGERP